MWYRSHFDDFANHILLVVFENDATAGDTQRKQL